MNRYYDRYFDPEDTGRCFCPDCRSDRITSTSEEDYFEVGDEVECLDCFEVFIVKPYYYN